MGELLIVYGQNFKGKLSYLYKVFLNNFKNKGKTTAVLHIISDMNNDKNRREAFYVSFRRGDKESGLTLEQALGKAIGIPVEVYMDSKFLSSEVLFSAVDALNEQGKQPIIIFEDIHTFIHNINDYNKETKSYSLPSHVTDFLNIFIQKIGEGKIYLILTISELGKVDCFEQLSGTGRIDKHRFSGASYEDVLKMLKTAKKNPLLGQEKDSATADDPVLKKIFGDDADKASVIIAERVGGDMGTLMKILKNMNKKKIPKNMSIEEFIEENLPLSDKFAGFVSGRVVNVVRKDNTPIHEETEEALMIEMLMRCANESKDGKPLLLDNSFFDKLKENHTLSDPEENRFIDAIDLRDSMPLLEKENLFVRISMKFDNYEPHKRILVEEWKDWIKEPGNKLKLEATRQAFMKQKNVEFPDSKVVEDVCKQFFGPKEKQKNSNK